MEHISKQLAAIRPLNLVPAKQELQLQKLGKEEIDLAKSLEEKKIYQLSDINPLKEVLRYVMVLIGLRASNWPNDEEKAVLIDFIASNYGGHTPGEIRLAFTMAINGSLDVEASCYENFSVLYFSGIMNAYREWSKQAVHNIPKKELPALPPPKITDEDFIKGVFAMFRIQGDYRLIPLEAYRILEPELKLSREEKLRIHQHIHETTREGNLKDLCRQYAVAEYFLRKMKSK